VFPKGTAYEASEKLQKSNYVGEDAKMENRNGLIISFTKRASLGLTIAGIAATIISLRSYLRKIGTIYSLRACLRLWVDEEAPGQSWTK